VARSAIEGGDNQNKVHYRFQLNNKSVHSSMNLNIYEIFKRQN
jgi:hypothetical protein